MRKYKPQYQRRSEQMNTTRSTFKLAIPLGLLAVSTVMAPAPASAMTVSGFTADANVPDSACMDKWASQVDNSCSRTIQVHFDVAWPASPDHYYAHVWTGTGYTISCWAESWTYNMDNKYTGQTITATGTSSTTLDLGTISTFNTHNVVCNMGPGSSIHSVDG
jgi:hypothetical protein